MEIPDDVWINEIIVYLEFIDILKLSYTNKRMQYIINEKIMKKQEFYLGFQSCEYNDYTYYYSKRCKTANYRFILKNMRVARSISIIVYFYKNNYHIHPYDAYNMDKWMLSIIGNDIIENQLIGIDINFNYIKKLGRMIDESKIKIVIENGQFYMNNRLQICEKTYIDNTYSKKIYINNGGIFPIYTMLSYERRLNSICNIICT